MKKYVMLEATTGRISAIAGDGYHCGAGERLLEIPGELTADNLKDWVFQNGMLVYDALPVVDNHHPLTLEEINAAKIEYLAIMVGVEL